MPLVNEQQLEPCKGPEPGKLCLRGLHHLADPAIRGYDGLWRCTACNTVHTEKVFQEAGQSVPNPGDEAKMLPVEGRTFEDKRRSALLARIARESIQGGRFTIPTPVAARPGDPRDLRSLMQQRRDEPSETEEQRRARIFQKYSVKRGPA